MKKIIFGVILCLILTGCNSNETTENILSIVENAIDSRDEITDIGEDIVDSIDKDAIKDKINETKDIIVDLKDKTGKIVNKKQFKSQEIDEFCPDDLEIPLNLSVDELILDVEISEADGSPYKRDDYNISYRKFEFKGKEFKTIRNYLYYDSEWNKGNYYICPYTEEKFTSSKGLDFDHIIPLAYVNEHNGYYWSESKKKEYGIDPRVGVDVKASANRIKSAKGPSKWLPEENVEDYCYTWLLIAYMYDISLSVEDMNIIKEVLDDVNENNLTPINEAA